MILAPRNRPITPPMSPEIQIYYYFNRLSELKLLLNKNLSTEQKNVVTKKESQSTERRKTVSK